MEQRRVINKIENNKQIYNYIGDKRFKVYTDVECRHNTHFRHAISELMKYIIFV